MQKLLLLFQLQFKIMKLGCAFLLGCVYLLPLVFAGILKDYNAEQGCGKLD